MEDQDTKWNGTTMVGLGLGALILLFLVAGDIIPVSKLSGNNTPSAEQLANIPPPPEPIFTESGIFMYDITKGDGAEAKSGMTVTVEYRGTLVDGTEFDSSYARNEPFTFTLSAGDVIAGWDEGIVGMRVGGERAMVIPPELAYGDEENGPIPPGSILNFEVKLLAVEGGDTIDDEMLDTADGEVMGEGTEE